MGFVVWLGGFCGVCEWVLWCGWVGFVVCVNGFCGVVGWVLLCGWVGFVVWLGGFCGVCRSDIPGSRNFCDNCAM